MVELLLVLAIASILASVSIFYLSAYQRLYKPDDEALKLVDLLQEAREQIPFSATKADQTIFKLQFWRVQPNWSGNRREK